VEEDKEKPKLERAKDAVGGAANKAKDSVTGVFKKG
jgi:hypothetical protein